MREVRDPAAYTTRLLGFYLASIESAVVSNLHVTPGRAPQLTFGSDSLTGRRSDRGDIQRMGSIEPFHWASAEVIELAFLGIGRP